MFGAQLRCDNCGRYKPDRCTCHGEPQQKALTQAEIDAAMREQDVFTWPPERSLEAHEMPGVEAEEDLYPCFPVTPIRNNNTCEEIPMQDGFNGTTASDFPLLVPSQTDHVGEIRRKQVYATPDPKYVIIDNQLCNAATHLPIPQNEPIMIFRAKDACAIYGMSAYAQKVMDMRGDIRHVQKVADRIAEFQQFAYAFPQLMKMPDTQ